MAKLEAVKERTFVLQICKVNINVTHGGVSDVRKHLANAKHQQLVKAEGNTKDLRKFMAQSPVQDAERFYLLFLLRSTIFPFLLQITFLA